MGSWLIRGVGVPDETPTADPGSVTGKTEGCANERCWPKAASVEVPA